MKNKIIILLTLLLSFGIANATKVQGTVTTVLLSGDGSGNYNTVSRFLLPTLEEIEGVQCTTRLDIRIHCADPGSNACPTAMSKSSDNPNLINLYSVAAVNALQSHYDLAIVQVNAGILSGSSSGTIVTPDSRSYSYSINWNTVGTKTTLTMDYAEL